MKQVSLPKIVNDGQVNEPVNSMSSLTDIRRGSLPK